MTPTPKPLFYLVPLQDHTLEHLWNAAKITRTLLEEDQIGINVPLLGGTAPEHLRLVEIEFGDTKCSLDIEPASNVILFHDHSSIVRARIYGDCSIDFKLNDVRCAALIPGALAIIELHRAKGYPRSIAFKIQWRQDFDETCRRIEEWWVGRVRGPDVPRLFILVHFKEDVDMDADAADGTTAQSCRKLPWRYCQIEPALHAGDTVSVFRVVNLNDLSKLAMKRRQCKPRRQYWHDGKIEVEMLSKLKHVRGQGHSSPL